MISVLKLIVSSLAVLFAGIIIYIVIRDGQFDWDTTGSLITTLFFLIFFRLGLNIYPR
ncbi:hypothetical protein [Salisediminibacterium beveridgei]|uniref:Uncharacterized protein n=1 Tax=Salisediminibacterium beveridgei TaxID=632773 RepID=A0A1D7QZP6_9BACI|nr:hypothetical protein [Salisediminibacterium beveridgei]AOM84479.1 hypothetical protein BBEV_3163 [Salisediminibacterium beveridgei]